MSAIIITSQDVPHLSSNAIKAVKTLIWTMYTVECEGIGNVHYAIRARTKVFLLDKEGIYITEVGYDLIGKVHFNERVYFDE